VLLQKPGQEIEKVLLAFRECHGNIIGEEKENVQRKIDEDPMECSLSLGSFCNGGGSKAYPATDRPTIDGGSGLSLGVRPAGSARRGRKYHRRNVQPFSAV
jgi:hypothetical protein